MQMKTLLLATILPISLTFAACSNEPDAAVSTEDGSVITVDDPIEARENTMKDWKDATGLMGDMLDNPESFDAETFKEQAQYLAEDANSPWQHFMDAEEQYEGETALWITNADEFEADAMAFKQATANLNTAAQTATSAADVQAEFADVKNSCKECHSTFKAD